MMKHLLSSAALVACLTAGLPVMAQTSSDSTKQPAAAQSGTTTGATTSSDAMDKSSKSAKSGRKHEASASDHMADQLNKQELQRVENGDQPTSGTSQPPASKPSAGSSGGAR